MAVFHCEGCDKQIDLDYDVEHYERCPDVIGKNSGSVV